MRRAFKLAAREMAVGKISGAVGTCTHLGPEIEQKICERLGLSDRADYVAGDRARPPRAISFARWRSSRRRWNAWRRKSVICSAPKCARWRSRLAGSSAAAPRCRTSGIRCRASRCAAWRAWCARMRWPALENIALWHERDISHSSVERVILPDSTILVDYMLHRTTEIVANMKVFPERMLPQSRRDQGPGFFGAAAAGSGGARRAARGRLQMGAERMRWRRGNRRPASGIASPPTRTFASISMKKRSRIPSICSGSCAPWTRFFARLRHKSLRRDVMR